jgi:methylthioribulose-1-phosphate dehydratase
MDAAGSGGAIPAWAVEAIVNAGRRLDALGYVPATAGNISVRLDADRIALTRSGGHKGFLTAENVMAVDLDGRPLTAGKPSAETGLHCQIYRMMPRVGAVLHGHSIAGTVLSMAAPGPIRFSGYEIVKAFEGQVTHDTTVELPVFDNDQDIARLAGRIAPVISAGASLGYYIRGHGAYVWAADMARALTHMEALEFLLACELERRKL